MTIVMNQLNQCQAWIGASSTSNKLHKKANKTGKNPYKDPEAGQEPRRSAIEDRKTGKLKRTNTEKTP